MNDTMTDLGRRAVACKGWRWTAGMLARSCASEWGSRVLLVYGDRLRLDVSDLPQCQWRDAGDWLPDFTDPATIGCLLALVREAWVDAGCWAECDGGDLTRWAVYSPATPSNRWRIGVGTTEAEALVAALEAAP